MKLPESYRNRLKTPLGILIPDNMLTRERIETMIPGNSYVITVGDRSTENMIKFGIVPSLQIVDGLEKRQKRPYPDFTHNVGCDDRVPMIIKVTNPPAEITTESISAICHAFSSEPPIRIHVDGEEDLLVIPVCVYAPENSVVLYGQPNQGLVVTVINDKVRNKTKDILDVMGRDDETVAV